MSEKGSKKIPKSFQQVSKSYPKLPLKCPKNIAKTSQENGKNVPKRSQKGPKIFQKVSKNSQQFQKSFRNSHKMSHINLHREISHAAWRFLIVKANSLDDFLQPQKLLLALTSPSHIAYIAPIIFDGGRTPLSGKCPD